jgi:hypothetical protein
LANRPLPRNQIERVDSLSSASGGARRFDCVQFVGKLAEAFAPIIGTIGPPVMVRVAGLAAPALDAGRPPKPRRAPMSARRPRPIICALQQVTLRQSIPARNRYQRFKLLRCLIPGFAVQIAAVDLPADLARALPIRF